ncbi:Transposable element P transposase [Papilio machaon]|uniref:Transposable element P transposase n=1 Tax=Papilio machaon TaxID=76193 RepID=A0A0N1IC55_PAPMA|nr:Transposable element P transposase [Papilio machaon]
MKLPSELSKLKIKLLKERLKCKTYKQMIKKAERNSQKFLHVIERFPETSFLFTKMQQQHIKKPRGRRFSIEEKILALSLYKQSPKAYNFMQRIFVLPSKRSLQQVLNLIPVEPGMNNVILENLKRRVKKLPEEKKLCTLIFDEVALTPGMQYSNIWDQIMGLEYPESGKHIKIADHALVFMIKGIKAKFKQPLCFTFCQGATKKEILKTLITDVIKKIHSCGLKVVATICDQGGPNMSAINSLYIETKEKYMRQNKEYQSLAFEVDDIKVFPIFDSPHLIKGIRNNFLEKNVRFIQGGKVKIAKWEHLKMLLDVDVGEDDIRMLNKLTEHHVIKEKIPKMKVKNAAQVFSQRVSATLRFLAKHNILPKECEDTAEFLFIFDKLFDAFYGHSYQESSKLYKSCLKVNSIHHKLWDDCLPILRSMQFETMGRGDGTKITKFVQVPSIKNWIKNILVFKEMINYTKNKYNVTSLLTRNFNQDPLENFFSSIRSNGVRNVSPTCWQFVCAFKTLLVNNFNSVHAVGANCEKHSNKALQCLKHLLRKGNKVVGSQTTVKENHCIDPLLEILSKDDNKNDTFLNEESKRYVGGFIVKKCKKLLKKLKYIFFTAQC